MHVCVCVHFVGVRVGNVSTLVCRLRGGYVCVCHLLVCVAITSRPDSAEGFSSCPSAGSRNGEKDWENESTTSSTPSNTEYTGRHRFR